MPLVKLGEALARARWRPPTGLALGVLVLLWASACGPSGPDRSRPNVVILLADDLGWNDVGFHGGPIDTPHLDRFAAESLVLERFYVTPSCVSTRAGLLTGRHPRREGALRPGDVTLAELLGEAGYRHRALVGKWHLGPVQHPLDRGFTHFYGALGGAIDYFDHRAVGVAKGGRLVLGEPDWYRDRKPDLEVGYSTDLIARESIRFLERHRDEPQFLYVAFNAPHVPLQAKPEDLAAFRAEAASDRSRAFGDNEEQNRRAYAAVVSALDGAIGAILAAIDRLGLRENTLVFFLSDNGAWVAHGIGDNAPLRGRKNTLWEGGIRVPAALRWPGVVPVGRSDDLVAYIDLVPTLQRITGAPLPDGHRLDGVDVLGVLRGEDPPPDRLLRIGPGSAVSRQWKLKDGALFDLQADPGETTDVAARHPDVVASLERRLRSGE